MQPWELANSSSEAGNYVLSSWLFLRMLGVIYLGAFVSLATQIKGLVGSRGILPARGFLLAKQDWGPKRFLQIPRLRPLTPLWIVSSGHSSVIQVPSAPFSG